MLLASLPTCCGTFHQPFHFSELLLFLVTLFACFRGVEHKLIWHSCIPYYVSLGCLLGPLLQPDIKQHLMFKCGWSRHSAVWTHSAIFFKSSAGEWVRRAEVIKLVTSSLLVPGAEPAVSKWHNSWEQENVVRMTGKR